MVQTTGFHPAVAPDPFAPLLVSGGGPEGRVARRRAAILSIARRLLADAPGQFTVRRLAEACGTTTQTLRNGFGRREELLVAAFNDHTSAVWRALAGFSSGPCMFLDLAEMYHCCALARPSFLRAMVVSAVGSIGPLGAAQRHGSTIKATHLRGMARDGVLRPGVDPATFAAHVTRLNTFMMYEWAMGGAAADLRGVMIDGNRRLLLGAVTQAHVPAVEAWRPTAH